MVITIEDFLLLPFYLIIIFAIVLRIRNKYYPVGHPWRDYFLYGFIAKITGAIMISLVYQYFWGYGDSFFYFYMGREIDKLDLSSWIHMITYSPDPSNVQEYTIVSNMGYMFDSFGNYMMFIFGAIVGLVCFSKYLLIAVILGSVSYIGNWLLFRMFAKTYPHLLKYVAIGTLFVPGVIVWGSGFLKDTICLCALSCLAYCFYVFFQLRTFRVKYLLLFSIAIWLLFSIKIYILLSFFPFYLIKSLLSFLKNIKGIGKKIFFLLVVAGLSSFLFLKSYGLIVEEFKRFSLENIAITAKNFNNAQIKNTEEVSGSGYDLGDFDPTAAGILSKFVPAVNVSLFRPYLWEARNPFVLLSAIESLIFLILTFRAFTSARPFTVIKNIFSDGNIIFNLLFAVTFAFFIGISTANFGTLVRFKIPMMPFFFMALIILIDKNKQSKATKPLSVNA